LGVLEKRALPFKRMGDAPTLDLDTASPDAVLSWWERTRTLLLDCDGVLWRATEGVPGVAQTVQLARAEGKRVFFVVSAAVEPRHGSRCKRGRRGSGTSSQKAACVAPASALRRASSAAFADQQQHQEPR
jgi:hypothetical protein